ncbi:hypothetical protein OC845_005653 [Tilletia horrida]|nr:hypothetical protein OC845_005653 [Tilletia horrida]
MLPLFARSIRRASSRAYNETSTPQQIKLTSRPGPRTTTQSPFSTSQRQQIPPPSGPALRQRNLLITLAVAVWVGGSFRVLDTYFISFLPTIGPSMLPTLAVEGDWLVTFHWPLFRLLDRLRTWQAQLVDYVSFQDAETRRRRQRLRDVEEARRKVAFLRTGGRPLAVGDLVQADVPYASGRQVCKRLIGLPGDTVLVDPRTRPLPASEWQRASTPSLARKSEDDDSSIDESTYQGGVVGSIPAEAVYITVPKGHVWIAGDNHSSSFDSRDYGPVPLAMIRGKIVAKARSFWTT